jgi:spermidine synthase
MLVDLDPEMTRLFSNNPLLTALNDRALLSPKVQVVNADAFLWVDSAADVFDFIVVDFPDPTNYSLGKLYTTVFFTALGHHLSERGAFVVQSTSPMFARKSFWCIAETVKQAGFQIFPYHAYVPSFGEWGYVLAARHEYTPPTVLPGGLRFLVATSLPALFEFPSDMAQVSMPANHLNDQVLVRTLEAEWREITR